MNDLAATLKKLAKTKLRDAKAEMLKPREDIVCYYVCRNAQKSMEQLFESYLVQHGRWNKSFDSLDKMHQACIEINPEFIDISLKMVECKEEKLGSNYCNSLERVSSCCNTAEHISQLLDKI